MKYDTVIVNGQVVLEEKVVCKNIGIISDRIVEIFDENQLYHADNIIDAQNCIVMPGAIDTHTHFFEPGAEYREDFYCGTKAAASGGFTCVMEMPNSNPAVVDTDTFLLKRGLAEKSAVIDYALWGGATATNFNQLDNLKKHGCVAFKGFTLDAGPQFPYLNTELEMEAMKIVAGMNMVLGFHAEDPVIVRRIKKTIQE